MNTHLQSTIKKVSKRLNTKVKLILSLLLLFVFIPNQSQATHVMGADITYRCISNLKFEVTVKYYRSCLGVGFSNPSSQTKVRCIGGSGSSNVSLTLSSIRDVTPICSKEASRCNPKNTYGTGEGIEEHTYKTTIDFNASPYSSMKNCCLIRFETGQCC